MTHGDAERVIAWYSAICPTSVDLSVALDVSGNADGFYVGVLNGELVASGIEIAVADGVGYGSMLYVDGRHRTVGLGRRMKDVARDVTERTSKKMLVGIDAHPELEAMNVKRGYKTQFAMTQYAGEVLADLDVGANGSTVHPVNTPCLLFNEKNGRSPSATLFVMSSMYSDMSPQIAPNDPYFGAVWGQPSVPCSPLAYHAFR